MTGRSSTGGAVTLRSLAPGPSRFIPTGPDLSVVEVDPRRETLLCASTDRKDFYHQFRVSSSKAIANAIGPAVPADQLSSTRAFAELAAPNSRYLREVRGDCLSDRPSLRRLLFDPVRLCLEGCQEAYSLCGLQGSDDKDQWGVDFCKIAVAHLGRPAPQP